MQGFELLRELLGWVAERFGAGGAVCSVVARLLLLAEQLETMLESEFHSHYENHSTTATHCGSLGSSDSSGVFFRTCTSQLCR